MIPCTNVLRWQQTHQKKPLQPLSYKLQSSSELEQWALVPTIHRDKNFTLSDQPEQLASTICSPVRDVAEIQNYQDRIILLCTQWFEKHTMVFPHQVLGVEIHTLNSLLLPTLVYSVEKDTLDLKVTLMSFVNSEGEPDIKPVLDQKVPWKKRLWLIPKIPVGNERSRVERINSDFMVMQDYPIELPSYPIRDKDSAEFLFSIPSISHLYNEEKNFYIVALDTRNGLVWRINESWPDGKKSMYFWFSQRNIKHSRKH